MKRRDKNRKNYFVFGSSYQMKMSFKGLVYSLVVLIVAMKAPAQELLNYDSLEFIRVFSGKKVTVVKSNERKPKYRYAYFLNGIKSDSTNIPIQFNLYNNLLDDDFLFAVRNNDGYIYYSISADGKLTELFASQTEFIGRINGSLIGVERNSYEKVEPAEEFRGVSGGMRHKNELMQTVVAEDITTKAKHELFNIRKLNIDEYEDIIDLFFLPNGKKILFTTGVYESGEHAISHVFVYDLLTGKISEKPLVQIGPKPEKYWNIYSLSNYDVTGRFLFIGDYVFNEDFEVLGRVLNKRISSQRVFLDLSREFFWVPSRIDATKNSLEQVLVPYKLTAEIEICLYKIYNNLKLSGSDIAKFKKTELSILK